MTPDEILAGYTKKYPDLNKKINQWRKNRDWPAWCFVPMALWGDMVAEKYGDDLNIYNAMDLQTLAAVGAWRYSRGVYNFDADLFEAVIKTPIIGELPAEVFFRLPEWYIYINTPGWVFEGRDCYGFWCGLDYDFRNQNAELRLLINTIDGNIAIPMIIGKHTITEGLDLIAKSAENQAHKMGRNWQKNDDDTIATATKINSMLSLVLYICAGEPDYDVTDRPGRPQAKRTKRGYNLFPANKTKIWQLGKQTGETIRAAHHQHAVCGKKSPHLRRAHWHGYWIGEKTDPRFIYKWLPPIFVAGN